jgi:hypothetical protein
VIAAPALAASLILGCPGRRQEQDIELAAIFVVVALLGALALGGSLHKLASTPFRHPWLVFAGLVLQVGVQLLSDRGLPETTAFALLLVSMGTIVVFLVLNLRLPGMALAGIGLALNLVVIAANGAMPVAPRAAASIGLTISEGQAGLKHEVMDADTSFPWLGDAIPVSPLRTVLSLGDVVLALGLALFVFEATKKRAGRRSATGASG